MCNPKLGFSIYMGFACEVWQTYELGYTFPCPESWWTAQAMRYERLWVIWGMGYDRSTYTLQGIVTGIEYVRLCFSSLFTWLNHRDAREIIGTEVSATKRNGSGEQEEIEQINTHTGLDILQTNKLIRI